MSFISNFFYKLVYYLTVALCQLLQFEYQLFEVFAGVTKVEYKGSSEYLINVFFNQTIIRNFYWGMAAIGIALMFAFTFIAVVRKMLDIEQKKGSLGQILGNAFKGLMLIILMNALITVVVSFTNTLMQEVELIATNADTLLDVTRIEYGSEDFTKMAQVMDTIGNYAVNPSYDSRYNVNQCFNEIREDLKDLKDKQIFNANYGDEVSWQSLLQAIALSAPLDEDLSLGDYHESVQNTVVAAMETIQKSSVIPVIEVYEAQNATVASNAETRMDALIFLSGTMNAAANKAYNGENASLGDALRSSYLSGRKDIYDEDSVEREFKLNKINYVLIIITVLLLARPFLSMIINCIARIFNLLVLYLTVTPFAAIMPLDDGEKIKQWTTAFVVQSFSVFGSVISIRLLTIVFPLIFSTDLNLFPEDAMLNLIARLFLLVGISFASDRASGMISGILASNAGFQSVQAGSVGDSYGGAGTVMAAAVGALGSVAGKVTRGAANIGSSPVQRIWNRTIGSLSHQFGRWRTGADVDAYTDHRQNERYRMHKEPKKEEPKKDPKDEPPAPPPNGLDN